MKKIMNSLIVILVVVSSASVISAGNAIGPKGGYDFDTDNLLIGFDTELGNAFQNFRFAPSLDVELGDNSFTAINADFRLYLFHLPESGLQFYGSAGPTLLFNSGGRNSNTELGLSLVAGLKIPMKGDKRYNLETRFGFGDIPDLKLTLSVLFGI